MQRLRAAGRGIRTLKAQRPAVKHRRQLLLPIPAASLHHPNSCGQADSGQQRQGRHASVGRDGKRHRLKVQSRRVRPHVVGTRSRTVKRRLIRNRRNRRITAAVNRDVARNGFHADTFQPLGKKPHVFHHEVRVTPARQHGARNSPVFIRPRVRRKPRRRPPRRAQAIQGHGRRHHLHDARRFHRPPCVHRRFHVPSVDVRDPDRRFTRSETGFANHSGDVGTQSRPSLACA